MLLDRILANDCGIITLRASDPQFLFHLIANIIVRNHDFENKTLYLHWVDYHKRYWSLDHDLLMKIAKRERVDFTSISRNLYFVRAFTRDNVEVEENWQTLFEFANGVNLAILDSVSELYDNRTDQKSTNHKSINSKTMPYAIGRFVRICMKNQCHGIVLDHAHLPIHPYLGEVSSVIVEFSFNGVMGVRLLKHPTLPEGSFILLSSNQRTLRSWF